MSKRSPRYLRWYLETKQSVLANYWQWQIIAFGRERKEKKKKNPILDPLKLFYPKFER